MYSSSLDCSLDMFFSRNAANWSHILSYKTLLLDGAALAKMSSTDGEVSIAHAD